MTALREMIRGDATITEISAWLDAQGTEDRLAATRKLGRADQRALFRRASSETFALEHFVPEGVAVRTAVHHDGRNTLPLPPRWKLFQKRFARPEDGSERLFGYNVGIANKLIGPGFFVAGYTTDNPQWVERGPIVIDYYQVPDGPVPDEWPEVVPNTKGLQRFAISDTRDFMRRVSEHVSIGSVYKAEKPLDQYFVLVRKDPTGR